MSNDNLPFKTNGITKTVISPTGDTICVPVERFKKILIAAEQKKLLEAEVSNLNEQIANYTQIIANLQQKDSATISGYNEQIRILTEQKKIYQESLTIANKLYKKERRKRKIQGILDGSLIAGAIYLYITK